MKLDELLDALTRAVDGMLMPSETDAPLVPFALTSLDAPALSASALLEALRRDGFTPVETTSLEELLAPLSEGGGVGVGRVRSLVELLETELTEVQAFRVGEVEIDALVLGRHPSGIWMGLCTRLVET